MVAVPSFAQAFWGGSEGDTLDFESGYDVNTVATVTGLIVAFQTTPDRSGIRMEIEESGRRMIVILGPQSYWDLQGLQLKTGDRVEVRGSKAQGKDGVLYVLAREVVDVSQGLSIVLRDEDGLPKWAGGDRRQNTVDDNSGDVENGGGGSGHGRGGHGGGGGGGGR